MSADPTALLLGAKCASRTYSSTETAGNVQSDLCNGLHALTPPTQFYVWSISNRIEATKKWPILQLQLWRASLAKDIMHSDDDAPQQARKPDAIASPEYQ